MHVLQCGCLTAPSVSDWCFVLVNWTAGLSNACRAQFIIILTDGRKFCSQGTLGPLPSRCTCISKDRAFEQDDSKKIAEYHVANSNSCSCWGVRIRISNNAGKLWVNVDHVAKGGVEGRSVSLSGRERLIPGACLLRHGLLLIPSAFLPPPSNFRSSLSPSQPRRPPLPFWIRQYRLQKIPVHSAMLR